jgi:superfamily II DNA/RNA helicase
LLDDITFDHLGVSPPLVDALAARGVYRPFPIQVQTLPDTLAGRDVLGRGKTGSGKTLAFSIPLASRLHARDRRPGRPTGLVLAPTRELATQIASTIEPLAGVRDLRVATIFGGVSQNRQAAALKSGVDIVVACPGRLDDLMKQGIINLDAVQVTVIDEADHLADLGFLPTVTRILAATPATGQRMLFSATLDAAVDTLVKRFLTDPLMRSLEEKTSSTSAMKHHLFYVDGIEAKKELVHRLAAGDSRRILFLRTKHQARKLARQLTQSGIASVELHGNLSQPARDRNLAAFAAGHARVLVATDIAARGVHVDNIELVVHVDPPVEHKAYVHRSGRTARAGASGDVVTIVLPEQRRETESMMRKAAIRAVPQKVSAASPAIHALVGEGAPRTAVASAAAAARRHREPTAVSSDRVSRAGARRRRSQRPATTSHHH